MAALAREIHACRRCPRLVRWREQSAADPPRRFSGQRYWARPLAGFGDPLARVVIVGLAPAAHGANRTGRLFSGDRSGDFLFSALYRAGLASQPNSTGPGDGLRLSDAYVSAVNRCPPPANRPTPAERANCLPYLEAELRLLRRARVLLALGGYAWEGTLRALRELGEELARPKPRFAHGAEAQLGKWTVIGCFHPSQQNTFTRRLTAAMLDAALTRALELAAERASPARAKSGG